MLVFAISKQQMIFIAVQNQDFSILNEKMHQHFWEQICKFRHCCAIKIYWIHKIFYDVIKLIIKSCFILTEKFLYVLTYLLVFAKLEQSIVFHSLTFLLVIMLWSNQYAPQWGQTFFDLVQGASKWNGRN